MLERVQSWLGGRLPAPGELEARASVQWTGDEWEVAVALRVGDVEGERRVRVATCGDAAEFLAVTIVLAVDPERAAELPSLAEASAPADVVEPEEPNESEASSEAQTTQVTEEPASAPPGEGSTRRTFWVLGAALEGTLGALPSFQVGPAVSVGVGRGPFVVSAGARYLPPVSQRPDGAVADISYSLAAGRVGVCMLGDFGFMHFGPCGAVDVGAMWTHQPLPADISETVPWVDLQAGALARFFGPRFSLTAGARFSVPVTQPLFVVSSGEVVHQPGVGLVFDLGLQFFFGQG